MPNVLVLVSNMCKIARALQVVSASRPGSLRPKPSLLILQEGSGRLLVILMRLA